MRTQWTSGKRKTERVAEDAWDHLVSAVDSAGSTARTVGHRAHDLADEASSRLGTASDRVGSAADEAWSRANRALDALAGRKPRKPWGWIAVAVLGGIVVGWAVAASAPKAVQAAVDKLNTQDEPDGAATPTGTTTVYETPATTGTTSTVSSGPPAV